MKEKRVVVTYLPEALAEELARLSREVNLSISKLVALAVAHFISEVRQVGMIKVLVGLQPHKGGNGHEGNIHS